MDGGHFAVDPHIDIMLAFEFCRGHQDQRFGILHEPAQIIGQRTVGIRDVLAPFEHDDLRRLVQSAHAGCCGCAAGNAAYYD